MDDSKISEAPLSTVDYYRLLRSQVEHEDNLNTQRISWFLASQSFLFTAYAIVLTSAGGSYLTTKSALLLVIPLISITAALLILIAILGGIIAMRDIRRRFNYYGLGDTVNHLPPIQGIAGTRLMGMGAAVLLPVLFMVVWTVIVIRQKA